MLLLLLVAQKQVGAQLIASNRLPDAPAPMTDMASVAEARSAAQPPITQRRLNAKSLSIALLIAGEALDTWTTHNNLTHPRWICGYSPALGNAVTYISNDGKKYDPQTIENQLCGPGPSGQLANYAYDVTRTGAYTETGWVTQLHLAGNRNFPAITAWNIADDVGQFFLARALGRRKGLLGKIAPGITLSRGAVHFECGILNLQFARTHINPSAWQFHVPDELSLYPAPRWWGRQ